MNYKRLFDVLNACSMEKWTGVLEPQLTDYFNNLNHGDYIRWNAAVDSLPAILPSQILFDASSVQIGNAVDCSEDVAEELMQQLKVLMPWRKGPYTLFGRLIDTEWRSDLKWSRLDKHIKPLNDRMVLDIGCGNGYYGWRMLGNNARYIVGLDPTLLFYMQFSAIKKYIPDANIDLLPFGIQKLSDFELNFDTVFSMGVIYHRRDPLEHLKQCFNCLKAGGELVLESLVIDDEKMDVLIPEDRYAKMNNVWAIPNTATMIHWTEQAGFKNARIIDVTQTTSDEQRQTEWMKFESLADFLDKEDKTKTIEGYPAPTRAILLADKP
ncbi:MAG: tRNA U34 carboxymethyltransferase [marine bacterium B5-7]|nr:MAG: tRNA U34 carboxymethyltransferase [marine bacterium B5-7]